MKPTPYDAALEADAAPFDSVPGRRLRHRSGSPRRSCRRPGSVTGTGSGRWSLDPAQNNAFRAINRAWKQGATVQAAPSAAAIATHQRAVRRARRTSS